MIMPHQPLWRVFTFVMTIGLGSWSSAADKPNFVLILVDDLGVNDLGVEGSQFYETPHIDQLASRGMRFTQAYAGCQVCSPSRASIQLGQFAARHGVTDWIGAASGMKWNRGDRLLPADYSHRLSLADTTLAEALREHGYRTFFAGKWHLGGDGSMPQDHGYDINVAGYDKGSPPGGYFSPFNNPYLPDGPVGESLPLRLANETAKFIETQASQSDQPFFAMLSFYSVHAPLETTPALWKKYRDKAVSKLHDAPRFKLDRTLPVRQVQDHPVYAGMMESMDSAVGVVMKQLQQSGIADKTVVIFTSDNGGVSSGDAYATSNLPLRGGKGRQWEGGIRAPLYIVANGVAVAGTTCSIPVTGADLYPTMLSLAGLPLKPQSHADGVDLKPLLQGNEIADRPLIWHYPHYGNQGGEPSSIYREANWKLIHYYEDDRVELYDLQHDPSEQNDLAASQSARASRMKQSLQTYLQQVGAKYPEPDPRYDPQQAERKLTQVRERQMPRLEKTHAEVLLPDWSPDPTWWGSLPSD